MNATPILLQPYQDFVLLKASQPRYLSASDFHLLHAALGLSTEWLEYMLAEEEEHENEELGDLLWYLMLAAFAVKYNVSDLPTTIEQPFDNSQEQLEKDLEIFVSLIKKHCVYGTQRDEELKLAFRDVWVMFVSHCSELDVDLATLISSNQAKLSQRYAAAFTQEESEQRKDKQDNDLQDAREN